MRNIKITIEYDGSGYVGWQRQPSGPTIQETIETSLMTITGERVKLLGSGR
ncbi:MAG TPA: tRNA pseudouridine(38-40) synthase TruA, partial [Thermodesulfobacteriota bacterium]|nr:tRNA pseudouridine(38-40) synthase TruA [Thermodesulfobacteriota bacterium]